MINLDQVRTLEWKVKQAVQLIVHLRRENDTLRGRLSDTEVRLQELESLLDAFKASQSELESGIRSALEELDNLEEGQEVPEAAGPVDPVSYPPSAEAVPAQESFPTDEPAALFERSGSFAEVDPGQKTDVGEPSFEEEFAALAAEEEAKAGQVEAPEVEAPPAEEKRPDQPGLGIF